MNSQPQMYATRRSGVILLVVLGALMFFSLIVASYVVFSKESHSASFALSQQSTRVPDANWVMNEALMTLIRGTTDPQSPFYGEDLLSDYYGHDGTALQVKHLNSFGLGPQFFADGFMRIPVAASGGLNRPAGVEPIDDVYAGGLITFTQGPLQDQTYRVLRSVYVPAIPQAPPNPPIPAYDNLYIDLSQSVFGRLNPTPADYLPLFYADPTDLTAGGFTLYLNGAPRNSRGIGFDGTDLNATTETNPPLKQPRDPTRPTNATTNPKQLGVGGYALPAALQPNHLGRSVNKSATPGDFDEGYDAPDHNNWFLSHRRADGTVIPSFHRPAVLNYILNEVNDWSAASANDYNNLMTSFARATFRPLPLASGQLYIGNPSTNIPPSLPVNAGFTGGSPKFALRTALPVMGRRGLLDQFADALINGEWDVDNDSDGVADSVWIDLGLPTFTSREGKLIRPLVAPMIEDLSSRLNLNAHDNLQLTSYEEVIDTATNQLQSVNVFGGMASEKALWAGTVQPLGHANNRASLLFRGLGWGPSEIVLPPIASDKVYNNPNLPGHTVARSNLRELRNDRYRNGEQLLTNPDFPGVSTRDPLDALRFGYRPQTQQAFFGFGCSSDAYGELGRGIGRSGHVLAAASELLTGPPAVEAINNPYETDPTGLLHGDRAFTLADLESVLRSNDFDSELLPSQLRNRLLLLIADRPEFANAFTTTSVSDDSPPTILSAGGTPFLSLVSLIDRLRQNDDPMSPRFNQTQWNALVAPDLRLGRKLDVNRRFGNLVDENNPGDLGYGVIDEPAEVNRADSDGFNQDGDLFPNNNPRTDELGEVGGEIRAYRDVNLPAPGAIPPSYNLSSAAPVYTFLEPRPAAGAIPVNGRQLLARHLYILLMAVSRDLQAPTTEAYLPSLVSPPPSSFAPDLYKARRLAQWAVNVVDYRDPDSIMTRFVFDATPFDADGWNPPADLLTAPAPEDHVVWGVEEPQLVFSETSAYHDVRLNDTNRDGNENATKTDQMPDDDSDQVRVPQGSLFMELYCTHSVINGDQQTKPGFPQELYTSNLTNGASELDLARSAPAGSGNGDGAPVWRIAISERHDAGVPTAPLDPAALRTALPDSASFELANPDELEFPPPAALSYDRFIWFRDFPGGDTNPDNAYNAITNLINNNNITDMAPRQVFFAPSLNSAPPSWNNPSNNDRLLAPGQFLTLAPRFETRFGSKEENAGIYPGIPSDHRFRLVENEGLVLGRQDGTRATPALNATTAFTPALPMLIAAPRPSTWGTGITLENMIGMNVSEPLPRGGNYYPEPQHQLNGSTDQDGDTLPDYPRTDAYIDFTDAATSARDTPLDVSIGRLPTSGLEPALGTFPNYCSAFLQRLADPTLPYDAVTNPYRTVDWIPIDLTVFSGEDRETNIDGGGGQYARRSRQRNGHIKRTDGSTTAANALYSYQTEIPRPAATIDSGAIDYFQFNGAGVAQHLQCSYSFLNTVAPNINPNFSGFAPSIGSNGNPGVTGNDRNLPQIAYAVHPWLNRPFASHLELMMVPACSQGRLFEEFSFDPAADPDIFPNAGSPADPAVFNAPFRHLLNFFHSSRTGGASLELAKLFDYVHTLPRFRGEVDLINPERLTSTNPADEAQLSVMRTLLQPPFAFQYDNKRQGTINLNTLSLFPVWAGLMQGHLNTVEFTNPLGSPGVADQLSFNNFIQSRRGYTVMPTSGATTIAGGGPFNYDPANLDPDFPTEFAGVFETGTVSPMAITLRNQADTDLLRHRAVHGTLLRGAGTLSSNEGQTSGSPLTTSLFVRSGQQLPSQTANPIHDRFRNAFMKYQTLMRMPNLTSDNSQVFLIRMTVGFFEVDAQTQTLQNEYNADLGRNQRYQATFVVDRSIPVGFIPGRDLNSRDVVVFESYSQ